MSHLLQDKRMASCSCNRMALLTQTIVVLVVE